MILLDRPYSTPFIQRRIGNGSVQPHRQTFTISEHSRSWNWAMLGYDCISKDLLRQVRDVICSHTMTVITDWLKKSRNNLNKSRSAGYHNVYRCHRRKHHHSTYRSLFQSPVLTWWISSGFSPCLICPHDSILWLLTQELLCLDNGIVLLCHFHLDHTNRQHRLSSDITHHCPYHIYYPQVLLH